MALNVRCPLSVGLLINSLSAFAQLPVVTLNYPPHSAIFSAPATIPISASASDPDGGTIVSAQFLLNGVPFTPPLANLGAGTYTINVNVMDSQGEVGTSNAATISVYSAVAGNTAPTIMAPTLPLSGSAYSLNSGSVVVPIFVNAIDTDAGGSVHRIEVWINNGYFGSVPGGSLNSSLSFTLPGQYSIVTRAYDNHGLYTATAAATVNIYAAVGGNIPPAANITLPAPGASYLPSATIPVTATATDPDGTINRVEFYRNNTLFAVMPPEPSYSFGMVGLSTGNYGLRIRAYDNLGLYTDSPTIPIVVNTPPVVSVTAPAVINAPASFNLQANATDADGNLSKVAFYQGTTPLGEDTSSPYTWSLNNVSWGTYTYTAKAYDALGAVVTSNAVNVVVNQPPTIGLTASSVQGGFAAPADILLTASPGDVDGTISKVEFYSGSQTTPINTRTVSPYTYTVTGAPAGTYTYTAKAYDNRSAVTTSNTVTITVSPPLSPAVFTYDEMGRLIGVQH